MNGAQLVKAQGDSSGMMSGLPAQASLLHGVDRFPNQGNSDNACNEDAAYDYQEQEDYAYAKFDP
jgi:hypothetical protein